MALVLPTVVDLKSNVLAVENQGTISSCTANATASACEMILKSHSDYRHLSRLFNYYEARKPSVLDNGTELRTVLSVLTTLGAPSENLWPYNISNMNVKPPTSVYTEGATRLLDTYSRITLDSATIDSIKSALYEGYLVVVSIVIDPDFQGISGDLVHQANYPWNGISYSNGIGNHAILIVGYNDYFNSFLILNSWGLGWGDRGFGLIPYSSMALSLNEAWVMKGINGKTLKPDLTTLPIVNFPSLSPIGLLIPYTNNSTSNLRISSVVVQNDSLGEFSLLNQGVLISTVVSPGAQLRIPVKYTVKQSCFTYPTVVVQGTYF